MASFQLAQQHSEREPTIGVICAHMVDFPVTYSIAGMSKQKALHDNLHYNYAVSINFRTDDCSLAKHYSLIKL